MSDITITYKGSEIASLSDTGTKNLLTSGKYCEGDITVAYTKPSAPSPTYQAKTNISPTTSSQTITADAGYDALSSVQINAMPSGSASTPATTITANPTITVSSGGLITATASASKSVTPTVSAGYVSAGTAGTVSVSGSNTKQLTAKAAATYTPTTADQTIASGQYLTGTQTLKGDANLLAENIKKDVSIFSIVGSYEGGGGGGGGGTEYVITQTQHPILGFFGFDLTTAGLSSSDILIDGNTLIWIEATSAFTMYCWLDTDDDDDFAVNIPSGTKFTCADVTAGQYSTTAMFVGKTSSTYGFFAMSADVGDDFLIHLSYGDEPASGGFVRSLSYKAQNGVPPFASNTFPLALHIVKFS